MRGGTRRGPCRLQLPIQIDLDRLSGRIIDTRHLLPGTYCIITASCCISTTPRSAGPRKTRSDIAICLDIKLITSIVAFTDRLHTH